MKLATYTVDGGAHTLGLVDTDAGTVLDLRAKHRELFGGDNADLADMLALIEAGPAGLDLVRRVVGHGGAEGAFESPLDGVRLLSPIPVPPQVRDFSAYAQHMRDAPVGAMRLKARIAGETPPDIPVDQRTLPEIYASQPIYYLTNRFGVAGHDEDVRWPSYSEYLDYELELGIFIGPGGRDIPRERAGAHIFGYSIFNDFSARDRQIREMEGRMGPAKGKSFDTGNVIGPWIVTPDEIPDAYALGVKVLVNGEVWAENTTADILHSFEDMIAFVSRDETLHAGEFFGSGTVGGCSGMETDQWIKDGDVVELVIDGIGTLRNRVVRGA